MFRVISLLVTFWFACQVKGMLRSSYCHTKTRKIVDKCTVRIDVYEFLLNFVKSCQTFTYTHCVCNYPFLVDYIQFPPYIFNESGNLEPKGIFAGIIKDAVSGCCMNCSKPKFLPPKLDALEFTVIQPSNVTVILPFLMYKDADSYMGLSFQPLMSTPGAYFATLYGSTVSVTMAKSLLTQVYGTWPLLTVSLLMALTAGVIVWLLDTWCNPESFPRSFSKGSSEGFWWAFISMTTVGYGDRCPRSTMARIFAIGWIFFGITITGMFVATLTSALTQVMMMGSPDFFNKEIGVLSYTSYEQNLVYAQEGNPRLYNNIESLMKALVKGDVEGIVVDKFFLQYHWNIFNRYGQLQVVSELHNPETVYGMAYPKDNNESIYWGKFLKSFFLNNKDNEKMMVKRAIKSLPEKLTALTPETKKPNSDMFAESKEIRWFIFVLLLVNGVLFALGLIVEGIKIASERGIFKFRKRTKKKHDDQELQPAIHDLHTSMVDDLMKVVKSYENKISQTVNSHDKF